LEDKYEKKYRHICSTLKFYSLEKDLTQIVRLDIAYKALMAITFWDMGNDY
jgi:hypothetical protein